MKKKPILFLLILCLCFSLTPILPARAAETSFFEGKATLSGFLGKLEEMTHTMAFGRELSAWDENELISYGEGRTIEKYRKTNNPKKIWDTDAEGNDIVIGSETITIAHGTSPDIYPEPESSDTTEDNSGEAAGETPPEEESNSPEPLAFHEENYTFYQSDKSFNDGRREVTTNVGFSVDGGRSLSVSRTPTGMTRSVGDTNWLTGTFGFTVEELLSTLPDPEVAKAIRANARAATDTTIELDTLRTGTLHERIDFRSRSNQVERVTWFHKKGEITLSFGSGLLYSVSYAEYAPSFFGNLMYRLYNPNSGEHFYTANTYERSQLITAGWNDEGEAWVAPFTSNTPVYRLYNPNAGDHHYTTNEDEKENLVGVGWISEDIGWYSDPEHAVPLFRLYNPNCTGAGAHHYTTSEPERDMLVNAGWQDEGIGWYGV